MKFLAVIVCTAILCGVSPETTAWEDGAINPKATSSDVQVAPVEVLDNEGEKLETSPADDEELTESSDEDDEDLEASLDSEDGLELAEDEEDAETAMEEGIKESEEGLEEVEELEEEEEGEEEEDQLLDVLKRKRKSKVFFYKFKHETPNSLPLSKICNPNTVFL